MKYTSKGQPHTHSSINTKRTKEEGDGRQRDDTYQKYCVCQGTAVECYDSSKYRQKQTDY